MKPFYAEFAHVQQTRDKLHNKSLHVTLWLTQILIEVISDEEEEDEEEAPSLTFKFTWFRY